MSGSSAALALAPEALSIRDVYNFHSAANFAFHQLHANACRFDGDLTAFLVYSAFMVASAADTLKAMPTAENIEMVNAVLSLQSISEMTGVPRETARRKCKQLIDLGLLESFSGSKYRSILAYEDVEQMVVQLRNIAKIIQ